jgi:hypothetical protein
MRNRWVVGIFLVGEGGGRRRRRIGGTVGY